MYKFLSLILVLTSCSIKPNISNERKMQQGSANINKSDPPNDNVPTQIADVINSIVTTKSDDTCCFVATSSNSSTSSVELTPNPNSYLTSKYEDIITTALNSATNSEIVTTQIIQESAKEVANQTTLPLVVATTEVKIPTPSIESVQNLEGQSTLINKQESIDTTHTLVTTSIQTIISVDVLDSTPIIESAPTPVVVMESSPPPTIESESTIEPESDQTSNQTSNQTNPTPIESQSSIESLMQVEIITNSVILNETIVESTPEPTPTPVVQVAPTPTPVVQVVPTPTPVVSSTGTCSNNSSAIADAHAKSSCSNANPAALKKK